MTTVLTVLAWVLALLGTSALVTFVAIVAFFAICDLGDPRSRTQREQFRDGLLSLAGGVGILLVFAGAFGSVFWAVWYLSQR